MVDRPRRYVTLGILMDFHSFPDEVQGKYCLVEALVPPGLGAPPNRHAGETETFFILEGQARFMIDDDVADHGPGSHVAIPDGAVHAFEAIGAEPCRMLILNAPGLMHERFFTGLGQPVPDDTTEPPVPDGPPDLAHVAEMAREVGMTLVPPS